MIFFNSLIFSFLFTPSIILFSYIFFNFVSRSLSLSLYLSFSLVWHAAALLQEEEEEEEEEEGRGGREGGRQEWL